MPPQLQKIFSFFTKSTGPGIGASDSENPFLLWANGKRISPTRAMQLDKELAYACSRAIAEELANMQWRLFQVGTDGTDKELYDHPLLDLLDGVNESMTGYELKYLTGKHLELAGNAYWFLDGVTKPTDVPTAIYPLVPDKVRPIVDHSQFPARVVSYRYIDNGKEREFQPCQILHLKYPDPNDMFEGIGTVQSIYNWIEGDNYAMEFNRRFFKNGARIGGVLESETARSEAQLDYIKKSFEAIHKGYDSAYKTLILPKGTKYSQASESQKDMDFARLMDAMLTRILAGFRVPRTVLGITDDVNRANAEATNYIFALRTIKPKMELICSYINEFLVPRFGENIYLDFEDPVPENTELKNQEMVASGGILSPNEMRERYFGYEPIENGNDVLVPFNVVPLGASAPVAGPAKSARPSQLRNRRKVEKIARVGKKRAELAQSFMDKVADNLKKLKMQQKRIAKKNVQDLTNEEYAVVYRGFALRVTNYVKVVAIAMRKLNDGQKERVLKNLPNAIKSVTRTKGVDPESLLDLASEVGITIDLVSPALTDLFGKEGEEAGKLVGVTGIDLLADEAMKNALDKAIALMAQSYNETTLGLLKSKLEAALAAGTSISELTDTVAQVYEFSDDVRAGQVARTEAYRVANDATKQAWKQSGVVKTMRWYTAEDEGVCEFCGPMDGKVVSIDDNFFDKGDSVEGSGGGSLAVDYSDVGSPPLHPECRCYVRPEDFND